MTKKYITTAIPYMNAAPHVGHAMDYCLADVCARYNRLIGNEVKFQAGTDEHGGKIFRKAKEAGIPVEEYVSRNVDVLKSFLEKLNVSYTDFVRTSDELHKRNVQEIWRKLKEYIYTAKYEGWYCSGCERFITEKEYDENNGLCPDHKKPYERLEETNYYFKVGEFKDRIREAIVSNEMVILPEFRKKEVLKLLDESPDVSISRPKEQLSWGIPVPDDDSQVMYVWFDALSNYITILGYPEKQISDWWPAEVQFVGKDVLRFHAIIWPAMLLGLGLPLPRKLLSHGMVLCDGQKMSKTVGNVVDPIEVIDKHGVDAFRYYFLRHIDTFADSDFTWEKFENAYNNELANDLGNLVQRLAVLVSKNQIDVVDEDIDLDNYREYLKLMDQFEYTKAFDYIWERIQELNRKIDEEKPWEMAKAGKTTELIDCLSVLIRSLLDVSWMLSPFLPETADKINNIFKGKIEPPKTPLFPKN